MVKPDATSKGYTGGILDQILQAGFTIKAMKWTRLTPEQAGNFYAVHKERPFYGELVSFMSSGPIVAAILEKDNAVADLSADSVDAGRLEQEVLFYLDKLDISEEKIRLRSHINYFHETLNEGNSSGKKLGFIVQEMGREINTIGSKSNHAIMQRKVVEMKNHLEKLKEQVQNVL